MSGQKNHPKHSADFSARQTTKKEHGKHSAIANFIERIHSADTLHLIAGAFQVVLGLAVVTTAALGLIRLIWVSALLTILGSLTSITGIYFCYYSFFSSKDDTLIRNAMRRIVEDQN